MLEATLAITNAHVLALDAKRPTAQAIAVYENRIVAVGSNEQIQKFTGKKTRIINANKGTVVPGLNDCHVHMTGFGQLLQTLELRNVKSITELQARLRTYVERNPERNWILGGRWDEGKFIEKRFLTRHDLDNVVPDKPVFLIRVCGHVGVANSKALQMAGIRGKTAIRGGRVELDPETGEPNGLLYEKALDMVWKAVPKPTAEELEENCILACRRAVEAGLTCVHWIVGSSKEIAIIHRLCSSGKLPLRVCLGIPIGLLDSLVSLMLPTGFGNETLKIGFVKILADGSLGGHTAALKKPYSDMPDTSGIMLYDQKELTRLLLKAHTAGLQLAVHAIGDHAIEAALNSFEKVLEKCPSKNHRHRVEHCSVLNPQLIKRMKRLGLIASVQPHFVPSDFWVIDRVGKARARWVYPFRTLMQKGIRVASGSDCPVEPISPILGIWAAASRKSFPEEALPVEEALKTYTVNAAYASFDEKDRGTIEVGKLADLTILSADPLSVPPDDIKLIKVQTTIVNGRVVYANKRVKKRN